MYNATGEIENYKDKRSLDQIEKNSTNSIENTVA